MATPLSTLFLFRPEKGGAAKCEVAGIVWSSQRATLFLPTPLDDAEETWRRPPKIKPLCPGGSELRWQGLRGLSEPGRWVL
jgi:hypothetical protein